MIADFNYLIRWLKWTIILFLWSGTQVVIRGRPAKALGQATGARVRIPPAPPRWYRSKILYYRFPV